MSRSTSPHFLLVSRLTFTPQELADKLLRVGKGYGYNLLPIIYGKDQEGFETYMRENYGVFNQSVANFTFGPERLKVSGAARPVRRLPVTGGKAHV